MKRINESKLIDILKKKKDDADKTLNRCLNNVEYGSATYVHGRIHELGDIVYSLEQGCFDIYDEVPDEPQKDEFIELHELEDTASHIGEMAMFGIDSDYSKAVSLVLCGYRPSKEGYHFISCDPRTGNMLTWKHCKAYKPF